MTGRGNKKKNLSELHLKWNVAVYARRSFDDQEDYESNTISNQKDYVLDFIKKNNNMHLIDYYCDDGYTGTNFNRPAFIQMMEDVKSGKINTIIVKDLSRLGRNHVLIGNYMEDIFPYYNLRLISINDDLDTYLKPDEAENILVSVKNLINENYARDISKKVLSAYTIMAKQGKYVSGTPPYGYSIDPEDKHHLVINDSEAVIIRRIFKMALEGNGKIKICQYLNDNGYLCRKELKRREKNSLSFEPFEIESRYLWSASSIGRILQSEVYIGNLAQLKTTKKNFKSKQIIIKEKEKWIISENTHEAIIDIETFKRVQEGIRERKTYKKKPKEFSIFNNKIKCYDCGKSMSKRGNLERRGEKPKYFCSTYLTVSKKCSPHKILVSDLEKAIIESISIQVKLVIELDRSLNKLLFKKSREEYEDEYKTKVKLSEIAISRLKEQKLSAYEDWKFGRIEKHDFLNVSENIEIQIEKVKNELQLYESNYRENLRRAKKADSWILHFKRNKKIKKLDKKILDELIDCIYVLENGSLRIIFKYEDEYNSLIEYLEKQGVDVKCPSGELVFM